MNFLKKAKLSAALAVAFGAMTVATQVSAVNLSDNGIGEVAIAPYFTTNDGWMTLINLTNTSNKPLVVKVRVHEGKNSRDVYDFNVALSGRDVFTAVMKKDANGKPSMSSTDKDTCLIGADRSEDTIVFPKTLNPLGYSGLDDRNKSSADALYVNEGSAGDDKRLSEGYVEFIVMGYTEVNSADVAADVGGVAVFNNTDGNTNTNTVGYNIENHLCGAVSNAFTKVNMEGNAGTTQLASTQSQFGEPINALKFNFRLLNPGRGLEVGNTSSTWANFFNGVGAVADGSITPLANTACTVGRGEERDGSGVPVSSAFAGTEWDPAGTGGSCQNLLTAQQPYAFLEPSLNDAFPVLANFYDDSANAAVGIVPGTVDPQRATVAGILPTPGGGRGVDALSATIQRSAAINEWSITSDLGSKTDWVVTFPTKGFFVDSGEGRQAARIPGDRDEAFYVADTYHAGTAATRADGSAAVQVYPPFASAFGATGSCNDVSFSRFDRAENAELAVDGVIPSPAPAGARTQLCWEANVLTFNGASSVLGSNNARNVPLPILTGAGASAGWMRLDLTSDSSAVAPAADTGVVDGGLMGMSGLPAIGFMVKQRTFPGTVSKNYASSVDHSYERDIKY